MRRFLVAVVLVATSLVALPPTARAQSLPAHEVCFRKWWTSPVAVRSMVDCFADRWGIARSTAEYVASHESGFRPHAVSWTGCCKGIYQLMDYEYGPWWHAFKATHPDRWMRARSFGVFNARANIIASLWFVHRNGWGTHCHPWCVL